MASPEAEATASRLVAERTWPFVLKLKHPVEFGSETIDTLTFRRGRMGDLKGMSVEGVPPAEHLMIIASRMCGQPTKVIELLEDEDGSEVVAIAIGFFARCLGAGKRA